jgi:hypothetical protein
LRSDRAIISGYSEFLVGQGIEPEVDGMTIKTFRTITAFALEMLIWDQFLRESDFDAKSLLL